MGLEMAVRDMERSDEEESDDEVQTLKGVWCWDLKRFYIFFLQNDFILYFCLYISIIFLFIYSTPFGMYDVYMNK